MVKTLLTELSFDLQIHICKFLHPTQIIALRQVCKTFQEATSQRIVWIHALNRMCHDNFLFLPTFPILDMSDTELERAATGPFRWIALSSSKDRNDDGLLPSRTTRVIKDPTATMLNDSQRLKYLGLIGLYLVPGGRYLVASGPDCIGVWDLGYTSDSNIALDGKPIHMWAATVKYIRYFLVHPTPDGLGIRILTYSSLHDALYVFEIYPQSEAPELVKIAELMLNFEEDEYITYSLNGNRVVIYECEKGTIVVWDFMANTTASWSISSVNLMDQIIKITETAIIILQSSLSDTPSLRIFQIPPLTTKTPLFNHEYLLEVAPILKFKCPKGASVWCQKPDGWYYGDLNTLPVYIDVLESHETSGFSRYKLDLASDLSNVSLQPICNATLQHPHKRSTTYRICGDRLVNIFDSYNPMKVEACTTSSAPSGSRAVGLGLAAFVHRPLGLFIHTMEILHQQKGKNFTPQYLASIPCLVPTYQDDIAPPSWSNSPKW